MQTGEWLARIAKIFVEQLLKHFSTDQKINADILYGAAYKGIPLAAVVAQEYYNQTGYSIGFASHRKEAKDHGSDIWTGIGMDILGKTCIILDDVVSAGTAFRIALDNIHKSGWTVGGFVILIDREEVTGDATIPPPWAPRVSAVMAAEQENHIKVVGSFTYSLVRQAIREGIIWSEEIGKALDEYYKKYGIHEYENFRNIQ